MSLSDLSTSHQNYLKTIWSLNEWDDTPITPSVLATKLGLRPSTVSDALKKLVEQELVDHTPYGTISLTPTGEQHALAMIRRHRLIETFLVNTLKYSWDQVHDEAEQLEHSVSDFLVDRIDELLGFPTRDPHGDPIPNAQGVVHTPQAQQLTRYETGSIVRVERISDNNPQLLQHLAEENITIGTLLKLTPGAPFTQSITVAKSNGQVTPLGEAALAEIWASRVSATEFSDTQP